MSTMSAEYQGIGPVPGLEDDLMYDGFGSEARDDQAAVPGPSHYNNNDNYEVTSPTDDAFLEGLFSPDIPMLKRLCKSLFPYFSSSKGKSTIDDDVGIIGTYTRILAHIESFTRMNFLMGRSTIVCRDITNTCFQKDELVSLVTFALVKAQSALDGIGLKYVRVLTIALFYYLRCLFTNEYTFKDIVFDRATSSCARHLNFFVSQAVYPCVNQTVWDFMIMCAITGDAAVTEDARSRFNLPTSEQFDTLRGSAAEYIFGVSGKENFSHWRYSATASPLYKPIVDLTTNTSPVSRAMHMIDESTHATKRNTDKLTRHVASTLEFYKQEVEEATDLITMRRCIAKITDLCVSTIRSHWEIEDEHTHVIRPQHKRSKTSPSLSPTPCVWPTALLE